MVDIKQQFKLSKPDVSVTSLDFDDSGELLLAACTDDSLQIYSAKEGKFVKTLLSQKYGAHLARFTHHSQSILYASTKKDDTIRYLSTHDNVFIRYFKGHTAPVTSLALCPKDDTFLSCSLDNTLRLWDIRSPNPQARLDLATPYLVAYDPSATVIAIGSPSTSSILLYDLRNYHVEPFVIFDIRPYESPPGSPQSWTRLEFSNDGKSLLLGTTSSKGHILLDAFSGELKAHCPRSPHTNTPFKPLRAAPGIPASSAQPLGQGDVCLSADGRYMIGASSGERDAVVWDTQGRIERDGVGEGEKVLRPTAALPCKGKAAVVEWNPRYNMLATADQEVVMWLPDEHVGPKPP